MMSPHDQHHDPSFEYEEEAGVSLRDIAGAVHRRRRAIGIALALLVVAYAIAAVFALLLQPSRKLTSMPFRLEFRGAERGEYPNGTKFNAAEIVGTQVLLKVFKSNQLDQIIPFDDFKSTVFVTESNRALDELARAYQAKLDDPKLTSVDRERIEKEFRDKKESINHNEYSLRLFTTEKTRQLPSVLRTKILSDILQTWAEQIVRDKGVALYDMSILSSGIFERDTLDSYDYVIALAMVRAKINRILSNIDQLLEIPGAKVVRTPKTNVSLAELRVRLEDVLNFKVQPLVGMVMSGGLSKNPDASIKFLETQLTFNDLAKQEAESRAKTLRDTLATYVDEQKRPMQEARKGGSEQPFPSQTVIPQIGDTFLDRLVDLTGKDTDTKFRQDLVDEMKGQALRVVPLEAEANYYRTLLESLRQIQNRARPARPEEQAAIKAQMDAAINEAITITDQMNEIYLMVSKNLNPSTVLYSSEAPVTTVERPISTARLLLYGLLLFLLALPASIIGAVLYDRLYGETGNVELEIAPAKAEAPATTKEIEAV